MGPLHATHERQPNAAKGDDAFRDGAAVEHGPDLQDFGCRLWINRRNRLN